MNSRHSSSNDGGLTALDAVKIVAIIVAVLVVIRVAASVVGAVVSLIWTVLIGVAVIAALWIAWGVFSRGRGSRS
ncbi:hypothetical protein [Patulibacter americanus]|uniref:hypothetical protein n=1 Tax=Patulibacter americanus TaxID=588672 RepID=UPI0003B3BE09|nr:hypothetical protein [Patulibacter americanus]